MSITDTATDDALRHIASLVDKQNRLLAERGVHMSEYATMEERHSAAWLANETKPQENEQ